MREIVSAGIGGFIGLEDPVLPTGHDGPRRGWPDGGVSHATGRAAFRAILETLRPRLVHLPSYLCSVVLEPLASTGIAWRRYPTAADLTHDAVPEPGPDELLVVLDHFGLQTDAMRSLARRFGERLAIDATQACFAVPPAEAWSFTSWRKFLGLPDGASAHGPRAIEPPGAAASTADIRHLELRAAGRLDAARAAFLEHERRLGDARRGPSKTTRRLLSGIDLDAVVARRLANFDRLHARLGRENLLRPSPARGGAPLAYPFLPERAIDRTELHRQRIFVPTFWPEMPGGDGPDAAEIPEPVAARLATRLLPLPLDQRYDTAQMDVVADAVLAILRR